VKRNLLYWIPTGLLVLMMGPGGVFDAMAGPQVLDVLHHLGYPDYFARLLGVAKILGVIAVLAPVPRWVREWAYAGFAFDLCAALVSHLAVGDGAGDVLPPVIGLVLVGVSCWAWRGRLAATEGVQPAVVPART
jgi:hypothetical protein